MNYLHRYHAGNVADVFKHYVLIEVLAALHAKPTPFCVIDTHAGAGMYTLESGGEWTHGIGALWPLRAQWPALHRYFSAVAQANAGEALRHYPGSPALVRASLRAPDRAVLLELHPQEYAQLKATVRADNIAIHHADAWNGLKGFVPPAENRGLVLIDPPYEQPDEFRTLARALKPALKHWRNGVYLIWYPIKAYRTVEKFYRALAQVAPQAQRVEFLTLPLDVENRLNGSGLILINPPWQLTEKLAEVLPPLARWFAGGSHGQVRIATVAD